MKFVNLTPHVVRLNDGREFQPSGEIARVGSAYTEFVFDVTGLPKPADDTVYIVSGMVAQAVSRERYDVVAPATGHPEAKRENGQIVSVPGFVRS